jgi:nucleotide-binding universal stress UspA family protein
MLPIRKILHPTDFSEPSRAAFAFACSLARDYSAELIILHVYRPPAAFAPDGIAVGAPVEDPYEPRAQLAQLRPTDPRVKFEHHVIEGEPADEILKAAKGQGIDVIVMGTHGNTGLTRLLMGSVAENVSRKATCPVLTLRTPFKSEERSADVTAAPAS